MEYQAQPGVAIVIWTCMVPALRLFKISDFFGSWFRLLRLRFATRRASGFDVAVERWVGMRL